MWQRIKNLFHLFQAFVANLYYGFPSRKIKVIGVTGTDGKTTTTQLIAHLLKESGKKVSFISTVFALIAGEKYNTGFHVTTPSSFFIQKMLRKAVENNDEYFVLETTSHAIDQNRIWGVRYEIAVLTNVTPEHLDYHQSYENYLKTKLRLLKMAKVVVVNKDDRSYQEIKNQKLKTKYCYGKLKIIDDIPNLTEFNKYNYSAAFMVGKILKLDEDKIIKALKSFTLPKGRLEVVYKNDFIVIIDFAHTPNAFQALLPEIKKKYLKKNGRLIHVFGSAGLRDRSKRPVMGEISSLLADFIILTEEDYRTEKPETICQEIAQGIKKTPYKIVIDRQQAINQAIKMARKNDVIVITGKAHEKSLARGRTEYQWDEYLAVKKALKLRRLR